MYPGKAHFDFGTSLRSWCLEVCRRDVGPRGKTVRSASPLESPTHSAVHVWLLLFVPLGTRESCVSSPPCCVGSTSLATLLEVLSLVGKTVIEGLIVPQGWLSTMSPNAHFDFDTSLRS